MADDTIKAFLIVFNLCMMRRPVAVGAPYFDGKEASNFIKMVEELSKDFHEREHYKTNTIKLIQSYFSAEGRREVRGLTIDNDDVWKTLKLKIMEGIQGRRIQDCRANHPVLGNHGERAIGHQGGPSCVCPYLLGDINGDEDPGTA